MKVVIECQEKNIEFFKSCLSELDVIYVDRSVPTHAKEFQDKICVEIKKADRKNNVEFPKSKFFDIRIARTIYQKIKQSNRVISDEIKESDKKLSVMYKLKKDGNNC